MTSHLFSELEVQSLPPGGCLWRSSEINGCWHLFQPDFRQPHSKYMSKSRSAAQYWGPPRGLGGNGNKDIYVRRTREQLSKNERNKGTKAIWGNREHRKPRCLFFGNRETKQFISREQGNRYSTGRVTVFWNVWFLPSFLPCVSACLLTYLALLISYLPSFIDFIISNASQNSQLCLLIHRLLDANISYLGNQIFKFDKTSYSVVNLVPAVNSYLSQWFALWSFHTHLFDQSIIDMVVSSSFSGQFVLIPLARPISL